MQPHAELPEKDWPAACKWKATGRARGTYIGLLCELVNNKLGDEGLKAIGEIYKEMAHRTFSDAFKKFGIEGNDAAAFAKYEKFTQDILGQDGEIVELSPKRAVVRWHKCHLFDTSKPVPLGTKVCDQTINYEATAAKLLNPKLKVTQTKHQTTGDPYCELVIEQED